MAVYPFYVEVNSSSRANKVGVGDRHRKAYMETYIYQRDKGEITTPFKIVQRSVEIGRELKLCTEVYYNGELIKTHITNY